MVSNPSSSCITPVERIYLELRQPAPSKPEPQAQETAAQIDLDASDVQAILQNRRSATPAELEHILSRAKFYRLNSRDKNEISVRLTVALASRGRPAPSPTAELLAQLDYVQTPAGLLANKSFFDRELRQGAQRIAACVHHTVPRCQCWREARERLWHIQDTYGTKSPEAWMAERMYILFEEMELAERPERIAAPNTPLMPRP